MHQNFEMNETIVRIAWHAARLSRKAFQRDQIGNCLDSKAESKAHRKILSFPAMSRVTSRYFDASIDSFRLPHNTLKSKQRGNRLMDVMAQR